MDVVRTWFDYIIGIYTADKLNWDIALGAIVLMGAYAVMHPYLSWNKRIKWYDLIPKGRGMAMRRARRNYVRLQVVDKLVDYVEEQVYSGAFTRKEASEIYRDARKYWPVKDLFPNPELLKENIKKRINGCVHEPIPAPLPDLKKKKVPMLKGKATTVPAKA